jgi:hypothetical protein
MGLTYRSLGMAASLLVLALAPARAERAMSCQDFRLALWRAIDDDGTRLRVRNSIKPSVGLDRPSAMK